MCTCIQITGTGRGLGRELAVQFAKLGAKVACVDVNQENNEETVRFIEDKIPGATVKAYTVNVAAIAEISALAVKVELDLGPVDVLINNAAVIIGHTFLGGDDHTIASVININLLAHFWVSRLLGLGLVRSDAQLHYRARCDGVIDDRAISTTICWLRD